MFKSLLAFRTSVALALTVGVALVADNQAQAQFRVFRGPNGAAAGNARLLPRQDIPLLNNGTLMTWANPNAGMPNQLDFTYFASLPLGDRMMRNGIMYDTGLIPNLMQGVNNPGGMNNQNLNNNNNNGFNGNCPPGQIFDPISGLCLPFRAARARSYGMGNAWAYANALQAQQAAYAGYLTNMRYAQNAYAQQASAQNAYAGFAVNAQSGFTPALGSSLTDPFGFSNTFGTRTLGAFGNFGPDANAFSGNPFAVNAFDKAAPPVNKEDRNKANDR